MLAGLVPPAKGSGNMAGTMTAPTAVTAATYKLVSIGFVDASGDVWSESLRVPVATTAAAIDAMIADIQERSNASIYKLEITEVREGVISTGNATTDPRSQSVFDHILLTFKNSVTGMSQRIFVPAPLEATFESPGGDVPNLTDLSDLGTAALVVLGAGYTFRTARYTERREINSAVRP